MRQVFGRDAYAVIFHASISLLDEQNGEALDTVYSQGQEAEAKPANIDARTARRLLGEDDTFLSSDMAEASQPEFKPLVERGALSLLLVSICPVSYTHLTLPTT